MRRLVPVLTTALLAVSGAAVPSTAAGGGSRVIVRAFDDRHDVKITRDGQLPERLRRSIEVKSVVVKERRHSVAFFIRVGRVHRTDRFTQIYLLDLTAEGYEFTQAELSPVSTSYPEDEHGIDHDIVTEGTGTASGFVECDHLRTAMRPGARRIWVVVPKRCLPRGAVSIHVYAQTTQGPQHDFGKQFSADHFTVPGRYDLGGTIPPGKG